MENMELSKMDIAKGLRAELNEESGWGFEISKVEGTDEVLVQTVISNSSGLTVNLAYLLFTDTEGNDKVQLTVSAFEMQKFNPDVLQVVLDKGTNVDFVKVYRADDRFGLSYISGIGRVTGDITIIYDTMIGMLDVMAEYLSHAR
jgi:hypothetical protein